MTMKQTNEIAGKRVLITWKRRTDWSLAETYTAVAMCVDPMGTLTFKRDEDGFLGIAGSGCWELLS